MRVVDCFCFFNELRMLRFRLTELGPFVDHFVIVEATKTHKGDPKPLYFLENKHLFTEWLPKIVHVVVSDMPEGSDPWFREKFQRYNLNRGLSQLNLADNDLIIIGDSDEIIDTTMLQLLKNANFRGIISLDQEFYSYTLETRLDKYEWHFAKVLCFETYKRFHYDPSSIRHYTSPPQNVLCPGGWHLSNFGDADFVATKIKSYAHQEFNKTEVIDIDGIRERIKTNKDFLNRTDIILRHIPYSENNHLPKNYKLLLD